MLIASEIGAALYQRAKLDPREPPRRGTIEIAVRLIGRAVILLQPRAMAEATVARVKGELRIVIRRGTSPQRANFLVGQMLGRLALKEEIGVESLEQERAVAAWLVAPPEPFCRRLHAVGVDLQALAAPFAITQTCAALRAAEVEQIDAAVTTPDTVHRRGKLFSWLPDEGLRELAAKPGLRNVRRRAVSDEPGRVALFSRAS